MAQTSRTFRVFVSSTFSDLKAERNALQDKVYRRLKELCAQHGTRFQAVDLRWGVSEEAGLDQQTMNICLGEIARCQKTSPRPNFIVLLGDRYGWCPLPPQILADEFEQIQKHTIDTDDLKLLHTWYKRDDNAVPPEYVLQPRLGNLAKYTDQDLWDSIEAKLRQILLKGLEKVSLPPQAMLKYITSATEQEIFNGALKVEDADQHVFCFFRHIEDLSVNESAQDFHNLLKVDGKWAIDQLAQGQLEDLKNDLKKALPGNIEEYKAGWEEKHQLPTDKHLNKLCEDVYTRLEKVILSEVKKIEDIKPLQREIIAHQTFAEQRARIFIGREDILEKIANYVKGNGSHPFAIWGKPGTGKSALIAKAIQQAQSDHPKSNLSYRFVSVTPDSSNGRTLLESLCKQITQFYGGDESTIPLEYTDLVQEFPKQLGLAKRKEPLIIFIDALNQLSDADNARDLNWLPSELPPNVHMIISTIPGSCLDVLQNKLPAENIVELSGLSVEDGTKILDKWLEESKRAFQQDQKSHVIAQFAHEGNPLYLKLAFEEARRWKSYDGLPMGADETPGLSPDIPGILHDLFWRLSQEANHGQMMVSRSLGYLAAARYGLSEDEILDVLSLDKEIGKDFHKRSPRSPKFKRLPVVIWSRLYYDLEAYMTEVSADDTTLFSFYHPQLAIAVSKEFLQERDKVKRHQMLAEYFGEMPLVIESADEKTPNRRKLSELPWQLAQAGSWQKLYDLLADLPFFAAVWETDSFEVKAYWAQIEGHSSLRLAKAYQPVINAPARYAAHVWNIALLLKNTGHPVEALSLQDYLVEHFRQTGNRKDLQASLNNQGRILYAHGDLDGAMALHKEAERICRELGDKAGLQASLNNQANILYTRGDLDRAMTLYKEQERICRELGDKAGLSRTFHNQAGILIDRGDLDRAMALLKEGERICRELGDKAGLSASLVNQANILNTRGDLDEAMVLYKEAERICRELGDKAVLSISLGNQAGILKARGDLDGAMALHKEEERICCELGNKDGLRVSLGNQANILKARGDLDGAMSLYKEAERICRELGNKEGLQRTLGNLANILKDRGDLDGAMALHKEKERICRELGNKEHLAISLINQASILGLRWNQTKDALTLADEAYRLATEHGYVALAKQIEGIRAQIRERQG